MLISFVVRRFQGGLVPRKARRELVVNLLSQHPDPVANAFPGLVGDELFHAIEQRIEVVGRKAVSIAPSNADVWTGPVVAQAVAALIEEEHDQHMQDFYRCLLMRIAQDWYGS